MATAGGAFGLAEGFSWLAAAQQAPYGGEAQLGFAGRMALNIFDAPAAEDAGGAAGGTNGAAGEVRGANGATDGASEGDVPGVVDALRASMLAAPERPLDAESILPHIENFDSSAPQHRKFAAGRFAKEREFRTALLGLPRAGKTAVLRQLQRLEAGGVGGPGGLGEPGEQRAAGGAIAAQGAGAAAGLGALGAAGAATARI